MATDYYVYKGNELVYSGTGKEVQDYMGIKTPVSTIVSRNTIVKGIYTVRKKTTPYSRGEVVQKRIPSQYYRYKLLDSDGKIVMHNVSSKQIIEFLGLKPSYNVSMVAKNCGTINGFTVEYCISAFISQKEIEYENKRFKFRQFKQALKVGDTIKTLEVSHDLDDRNVSRWREYEVIYMNKYYLTGKPKRGKNVCWVWNALEILFIDGQLEKL